MYRTALVIPRLAPERARHVAATLDAAVAALRGEDTGFLRAALLRRGDGACVLEVAWRSEADLRAFLASAAAARITQATAALFSLEGATLERPEVLWSSDEA